MKNIISNTEQDTRKRIDSIFDIAPNGKVRTVCRTLVIVGGGTGASIGRGMKSYVNEMGMDPWVKFICVDTDSREQESQGSLQGFSEEEFCHLSMDPVKTFLADPAKDPFLAERLGLDDPVVHAQLSNIAEKNLLQAGAVRPLGLAALYANLSAFTSKVTAAANTLNHRWAEVENQKGCAEQVRLQDRFSVIMCGSACGGTWSSLPVDISVLVKKELQDVANLEMSLTLILPDVFESALVGKPDEWARLQANAHSCLVEVDAFCNGWAETQGVKLGRCEKESMKAPAGIWSNVFLVSRRDSAGNDLGGPENVFSTVAQSLGAEIALSIGGKISSLNTNDVMRQGLTHCSDTKLPRSFSTLNSTAIAVPKERSVRDATARQMAGLYGTVLGDAGGSLDEDADAWLMEVELEERHGCNSSTTRFRAVAPPIDGFLTALTRHKRHKGRHKNRRYAPQFLVVRERFEDVALPRIEEAMDQARRKLADRVKNQIFEKLTWLLVNQGMLPAQDFFNQLQTAFAKIVAEQQDEIRVEENAAKTADQAAKTAIAKMSTFFGRFGKNESKQLQIESLLRRYCSLSISSMARQQTLTLIADIRGQVNRQLTQLTAEIRGAKTELHRLELLVQQNRVAHVIGDSHSELDVTPVGFKFFAENVMATSTLLEKLAEKQKETVAEVIRACGSDTHLVSDAMETIAKDHFSEALKKVNVVDVLGKILTQGGEAAELAKTQIQQALKTTQPLWDAKLSRLSETFSDLTVIGVPKLDGPYGQAVSSFLKNQAAVLLNKNPLYQGTATVVQTTDNLRIHIVRRTHGARPFYLARWLDWKQAARKWKEQGAHPTSVFPSKWIATLPPQEPKKEAARTDLAFAIALAYGWISKRGKHYARNLILQERGASSQYVVPYNSHSDSIAFEHQKPRQLPPGALSTFVNAGRMSFAGRNDVDSRVRLAMGREQALDAFRKDDNFCELVFSAFDALCEVAGNLHAAKELQEYLLLLDGQVKVGTRHYDQISEEIELLAGLMQELSMQG